MTVHGALKKFAAPPVKARSFNRNQPLDRGSNGFCLYQYSCLACQDRRDPIEVSLRYLRPEMLLEKLCNVGLVIDHQDAHDRADPPKLRPLLPARQAYRELGVGALFAGR
jgi:hypothetical protein